MEAQSRSQISPGVGETPEERLLITDGSASLSLGMQCAFESSQPLQTGNGKQDPGFSPATTTVSP